MILYLVGLGYVLDMTLQAYANKIKIGQMGIQQTQNLLGNKKIYSAN